ncbi:MAG: PAS domain-containing protein, partial [Pyrinomonadaceae bacterium]
AIHRGASDCLVRELLTPALLEQSICAVIQRADSLKAKAQYERCYLGLMENASDVIYTHDFQGNYTSINKAGEHLTGYTAEETLQMNFRQIVAPEYIPSVQRAVNRMLADRKRSFFEAMVITKDNRRVSVKVSMHLIYREGRPIGVQGIARQAWSIPSAFAAGEEHARSA